MIYTGILGSSYTQLGNIVLGDTTENIQDTINNNDFDNPITIVTSKGEEWVSNRLAGLAPEDLYVGWGTGTGDIEKDNPVDPSMTRTLFNENLESDRSLAVLSVKEYWPPDGSGKYVYYIAKAIKTAVSDISISEAGLFDAAEEGNLLVQSTFDDIRLTGNTYLRAGDSIIFSFALDPS